MTTKQNPKFQELVAKLREIFQIDRPELDFGSGQDRYLRG